MDFFRRVLGLFCLLILFACKKEVYSQQQIVFNTPCSIKTTSNVSLSSLFTFLKEFEVEVDCRMPDSLINSILANSSEVVFEGLQADIFLESVRLSRFLQGAFDPTIGQLVDLWKIGFGGSSVPSMEEIKKALAGCGIDKTKFFTLEDGRVKWQRGINITLDYGACAKGYAIDLLLKEQNLASNSILINLGGNIFVSGESFNGGKWKIGIQNPFSYRGDYCLVLELESGFVSTSGIYERYFEVEGKRYHHILDLKTGYPSESGLVSVSVIGQNGILCDACSTGFFVLGIDKSAELIKAHNMENGDSPISAIFITQGGEVYITENLKESLTFSSQDKSATNQIGQEFFLLKN